MSARPLGTLEPDPVIEALKRDVDRTLLRANLALTPLERLRQAQNAINQLDQLRRSFANRTDDQ